MTEYTAPEQQQIDHWLNVANEFIEEVLSNYQSNFYQVKDLPIQAFYTTIATAYTELAYAQFLNGEAPEIYRANLSKATSYIIKSFKMAYDKNDPDYVGDKKETDFSGFGYGCVDWFSVGEGVFIEGFHYALMSADFEQGRELSTLFRDRPDGRKLDKEIHRYAHALKCAALGEKEQGKALLKQTIDEGKGKKTKSPLKLNYQTLSHALYGILDNDEALFNRGLELQLHLHEPYARGEAKDTSEEFICDNAVALANLAIAYKIPVTVEHHLLPKDMLI
ncbi:MAG: Imm49 family immunity protein [Methylococcaceae bacterium]